jgi:cell division protein FtsW
MSAARSLALPFPVRLVPQPALDPVLVALTSTLLLGGLVVLASASIAVADGGQAGSFSFVWRQLLAIGVGLGGAVFMLCVPTTFWQRSGFLLVLLALALLAVVLIPGVGHAVNGSTRWLRIGSITIQVSEPARLAVILYLAGYIVRRGQDLSTRFVGFLKPMAVITLAAVLLLAEPDFGAATVLVATALAMLFIGGARIRDFLVFFGVAVAALATLAVTSPYRMRRLTAFLNPWEDPWDSGFQLTQSLIAIGRGEWFGVGLGASVQKMFYLPEAHTDFVFAVFAEEFGLLGALVLIGLFLALVWRILGLARRLAEAGHWFQAYAVFGFGIWLGLQAFINIGVNMGLLPTKGLPLPLVSYGRSSLIVTLAGIGFVLRACHELTAAPVSTGRGRRRKRAAA